MTALEEVFGVSRKMVKSYYPRKDIDSKFEDLLRSDQHIVVYGSTKQGKTSLVGKYLPFEENIVVMVSTKSQAVDIYKSILSKLGIRFLESVSYKSGSKAAGKFSAKVKAILPIFGSADASGSGEIEGSSEKQEQYTNVEINLEEPDLISDVLWTPIQLTQLFFSINSLGLIMPRAECGACEL